MGSNAKSGSAAKITLEKFDDLFGGSAAQGSGAEQIIVAAHLFWLQINLIDCHRINRYNDISIEKEKVPEHLFFCRDKCSGTIYKHGYYIKIRNRIQ